ncbi:MFS transporter [Streptomyces sp. NPDC005805]|uniref:MFS transporter n=1 Tax=Streptomyces sp. NPDC005805 TaxID=3157068 RepID=UPI0033BFD0AA
MSRTALTTSVLGAAVVAMDGTVLTVVQPTLQKELDAGFAQVQWTSTGYLIAVAALLVLAGRLGDRYGHRRMFALGITGFGATAAGIGLAPGIDWVIGLRVAQGVFGALLQPATLGMLRAAFPPDRLARPIALRTAAIGLAAAVGPLAGGALTAHLGWRAVFLLQAVPAVAVGLAALAARPDAPPAAPPGPHPTPRPGGLDLAGAALLAATLGALVHMLVTVPETGWTAPTAAAAVAGVLAALVFARHERRAPYPLLPRAVLRAAGVRPALAALVAASAAMFGVLFCATYFLQYVQGCDALGSGLVALPVACAMVLGAPLAPRLARRWGDRRTSVAAMGLLALGTLLLSRLDASAPWWEAGAGFACLGAGFTTVMVTATAVIVRQIPTEHAGVAGGLQQTAMSIGPAAGVATAGALLAATAPRGFTAVPVLLAALPLLGVLAASALPGRGRNRSGGRRHSGPAHQDRPPVREA